MRPQAFPFWPCYLWRTSGCSSVVAVFAPAGDQHYIYSTGGPYIPFWLCVAWSYIDKLPKVDNIVFYASMRLQVCWTSIGIIVADGSSLEFRMAGFRNGVPQVARPVHDQSSFH